MDRAVIQKGRSKDVKYQFIPLCPLDHHTQEIHAHMSHFLHISPLKKCAAKYFFYEPAVACCTGSAKAQRNMHRDVIKWILVLMSHMLKLLHWIMAQMLRCNLKASPTYARSDAQIDLFPFK